MSTFAVLRASSDIISLELTCCSNVVLIINKGNSMVVVLL